MNIRTDLPETMIGAGQFFGQTLAELGVREVFAIVGSHIGPLLAGCEDAGIAIIDTRHEATAGHAAEGYAKACGRPGVCIVTAGPGFTNVLTAIMGCFVDAAPAIFVAGAAPLRNGGPNPLQGGFSQIEMARPVTKAAFVVRQAGEIPDLLRLAWRIATSGRPGPVLIEIATDVAHSESAIIPDDYPATTARDAAAPALEAHVERAAELLAAARRPIIVAGGGVKYAAAHAELRALVESAGLPVLTNFDSHGVIPADSPHWCGSLNLASRLPEAAQCDLLLFVGARFGLLTGGMPGRFTHPGLRIVQVDIDAAELKHLRPNDLGIVADCRDFLRRLNACLAHQRADAPPGREAWLARWRASAAAVRAAWERETCRDGCIHPYRLARCIAASAPRDAIYVVDGGDSKHWIEMNLAPDRPGRYISRAYSGILGCSQGLAIGAHLAHPEAPVCQIVGDGAWGFHLQEIDTYVRHALPIVTVVVNNGAWGSIRHIQQRLWKGQRYVATDLGFARYDQVAAGFGCPACRVDTAAALADALQEAFASGRPWLIDAVADPEPDPLAPPV